MTVTDENGRGGSTQKIIAVPTTPVADAGSDQTMVIGPVQIGGNPTGSSGVPGYTYSWYPPTGLDNAALANPTASPSLVQRGRNKPVF